MEADLCKVLFHSSLTHGNQCYQDMKVVVHQEDGNTLKCFHLSCPPVLLLHTRTVLKNIKCKNIFTKMLKDVGIDVPKSIETRSKYTMHADKGRG